MIQKSALVTGAGSGIGEETALLLGQEGYFVFLLGRRVEKLDAVRKKLGDQAMSLPCDLNESSQIQKAVKDVSTKTNGALNILVNNAAIYERHKITDVNSELWRRTFQANLFGTVELTERLVPLLAKSENAAIVNVSSTLGLRPIAETSAYSASKAALVNWTLSLALELAPHIRANCVCPGIVDTPIHPFHSLPPAEKEKALKELSGMQPLNRIGTPREIAEAVAFLALPKSSWTTGSTLTVDGGINLNS